MDEVLYGSADSDEEQSHHEEEVRHAFDLHYHLRAPNSVRTHTHTQTHTHTHTRTDTHTQFASKIRIGVAGT